MKPCLFLIALLAASEAIAKAEDQSNAPDAIIISAVISDPEHGLNSETLVIRCLPNNRTAWQFRASRSFSGELDFAKEQFRSFATVLSTELDMYSLDESNSMNENVRSEIYVFTVLSKGRVVISKTVIEDFFKQEQPSSILGKPLLEHVRRDVLARFYLHGYLATTLPYDYETRGYPPGKPTVVHPSGLQPKSKQGEGESEGITEQ